MTISSRVATLGHSPAGRLARGEILEQGRVLGARFPILMAFTHGFQCDPDNGDSSHRDGNEGALVDPSGLTSGLLIFFTLSHQWVWRPSHHRREGHSCSCSLYPPR